MDMSKLLLMDYISSLPASFDQLTSVDAELIFNKPSTKLTKKEAKKNS